MSKLTNSAAVTASFPTIFTPQGDGNYNWIWIIFRSNIIPDNIYPARGRKPLTFFSANLSKIDSRQYLPRKGTETIKSNCIPIIRSHIPDNIYPARGRKPFLICMWVLIFNLFPTIFTPQGDGNFNNHMLILTNIEFPTIFTPQGDGNIAITFPSIKQISLIPDNIYPARGRKPGANSATIPSASVGIWFPTIFTPQGDGNLLKWRVRDCSKANSRQYLPRKGTETLRLSLETHQRN